MTPQYLYDWTGDVARYRNILGGPALTFEEMILDAIDRHAVHVIVGHTVISVDSLVNQAAERGTR